MSVIAKVFVVLLTVFSIAFAMATISFVNRQENWRQVAADWRATGLSSAAEVRLVTAQMKLTHDQDLARITELKNQTDELSRKATDQSSRIDELSNENAQLQSQISSLSGSLKGVQQTLSVTQGQLVSEQDFSRQLARRNSELERRNIDLNDRTKELTVSLAMAHQQNKAYLEQISALEQRAGGGYTQLPDAGISMQANVPSAFPTAELVPPPLRGQVTEIRGKLASISIGTADGVARGMTFMVYRAGDGGRSQYLGTLEVGRVEANRAAGSIIRESNEPIRVGDIVRDEASFKRENG